MSERVRAACEKREIYKIQFPVLHVMGTKHKCGYLVEAEICADSRISLNIYSAYLFGCLQTQKKMDKPYHDPAYSGNGTLMLVCFK
jgi:hypothetical protein